MSIYDFGFDNSLNRGTNDQSVTDSNPATPAVYDTFDSAAAQNINFGNLVVGTQNSLVILDPAHGLSLGSNKFATAPFKVNMNGELSASSITITGGSVYASAIVGIINQSNLNVANRGWNQTCTFSITDADTIAWGVGTFTASDGSSFAISAGNTGNMVAKTYIYLDTTVSTTVYQTTTTAATAVGAGKVLIAVAQNGTGEASFVTMNDKQVNIDASSIVANSITANELSTSITYAGQIIVDTNGNIRSGQTAYNTGTGWFLGNVAGTAKFSFGDPTGNRVTWDGSNLVIVGDLPKVEIFTANGTWTKHPNAKTVQVVCIGAGGQGGSGRKGAAGNARNGGTGGGAGNVTIATFQASTLGSTETVTVGTAGAAAGASQTTNSSDGNNGSNGTESTFGTWLFAGGGGGGIGGASGASSGGGGGGSIGNGSTTTGGSPTAAAGTDAISGQGPNGRSTSPYALNGEWGGGSGGATDSAQTGHDGGGSIYGGGGGGAGGGIDTGNGYDQPGAGGTVRSYTPGGGGAAGVSQNSATAGTPGSANSTLLKGYGGSGGGGGGSSQTGNGAIGGAGGIPGGGGGGGGASKDATGNSGAGAAGARGEVRVYSW